MYFLVQGQTAHIDDPRYQVFEDSSQFLNAIVVKTKTREPQGLDVQLRRGLSQINPDLAVTGFGFHRALWSCGVFSGTAHQ
jgi:hypothetical protein